MMLCDHLFTLLFYSFQGPTRRLISKPIVCAISGFCLSSGFELALMCDLRVVENNAILGFEREHGVPIMDGGTVRLPAIVGLSRALDIILTGRKVPAKDAFEMGLANRIVAPGSCKFPSISKTIRKKKFFLAIRKIPENWIFILGA